MTPADLLVLVPVHLGVEKSLSPLLSLDQLHSQRFLQDATHVRRKSPSWPGGGESSNSSTLFDAPPSEPPSVDSNQMHSAVKAAQLLHISPEAAVQLEAYSGSDKHDAVEAPASKQVSGVGTGNVTRPPVALAGPKAVEAAEEKISVQSKGSAALWDAAVEHKPHSELPAHPVMMNSGSADGREWSLASSEDVPAASLSAAAGGDKGMAAGAADSSTSPAHGAALEDDKTEVPGNASSASPPPVTFASAGMQHCQLQGDCLPPTPTTHYAMALYLLEQLMCDLECPGTNPLKII